MAGISVMKRRKGTAAMTRTKRKQVSSKGGKYGFVYKSRQNVYRALRRKGLTKSKAAQISNAGRTHLQRKAMAKRGAAHRRARGK